MPPRCLCLRTCACNVANAQHVGWQASTVAVCAGVALYQLLTLRKVRVDELQSLGKFRVIFQPVLNP